MEELRRKGSFWPSYVDIMTTLFAIVLVLFVVSYSRFKTKENELRVIADKYEEIKSIYQTVENIDSTYFEYNQQYSKFIFKIRVQYQTGESSLFKLSEDRTNKVQADSLRNQIMNAGREIRNTILNLQNKEITNQDFKYLVVIEGQASDDNYAYNDVLSYQRALELHRFWVNEAQIDFTKMDHCELVISGSGTKGVPRDTTNEKNNQRFLIHIVPVIGNIKMDDSFNIN